MHANLEALETVLADIDKRGLEQVICLGDNIGYGPDPCACLDRVIERCAWSIMGNHDYAVLYEPTNFNAGAESASFWSRRQLELEPDPDRRMRRWEFLGRSKIRYSADGVLCVHGSPRRPINEYIFTNDATTAPTKMQQIFERIERVCLVGHTHIQGLFTDEPDFYPPVEFNHVYKFRPNEKVIANVGSVGQPRDRDPRSGYAILYDDRIEFVRLEYNIAAVINKIESNPELNDFFGQRLREGR